MLQHSHRWQKIEAILSLKLKVFLLDEETDGHSVNWSNCEKEATRATGLLLLHGLRPEPGSKIRPWGSGVLDLLAVDSLALYNNWIALRPHGSEEEEETEAALYLRGPHPDPKLRVEAARDHEDNTRGPEIGAERQGDKERKPESLQQGNDIPPRGPHWRRVIRMLEEPGAH
ncbi:hypothetical protein NDU88_006066 [Pleurodeles waltl]|uniref:Uncharacterized protein n=1 Tax=Pleurodeles waltl TaxID=8319 RepID=A0AAV7VN65_PLEWA|nr:hypothetical protein NDU88_006066 [Pleurodeles waltl]